MISAGLEMENFIDLNLPKNINLEINLLGGDISLDNIHGESILETLGGDININNHEGRQIQKQMVVILKSIK